MASNPYDAALEAAQQGASSPSNPYAASIQAAAAEMRASDNPYETAANKLAQARHTALQRSILSALDTTPDAAAKAQKIETATGIPASVALRNPAEAGKVAAQNEYNRILASNPKLADAMRDPKFSAVAHDDLGVLSRIGHVLEAGYLHFSSGGWGTLRAASDVLGQGADFLGRHGFLPANPFAPASAFFAKQQQFAEHWAQAREKPAMQSAGPIERGVYSGLEGVAQNAVPLAAAAITGDPALALGPIATSTFGSEYGNARAHGLSVGQSVTHGATQAAIMYAANEIPVSKLLQGLDTQRFLPALVQQLGTLVPAVEAQTAASDLVNWADLHPDKPFSEFVKQEPGRLGQALISAVTMAALQTGTLHGLHAAATHFVSGQARAAQAEDAHATLSDLNTAAAKSKLRTRSPEQFKQYVENQAPDASVFVNAAEFDHALAQSKFDPTELPDEIKSQLAEARATDGDVKIPVSDLATHFAGRVGDALLPHLRTSPEAMSFAESQAFAQGGSDEFQREAEAATQVAMDTAQADAGATTVRDAIQEGLDLTSRFTKDVNKAYAHLTSSFYETMAHRLGTTPEELFKRIPLHVVAANLTDAFEQSAFHGSPHLFDHFDLQHIGSGEGAQAYGWGLYFAENPKIAGHYAEQLAGPRVVLNGKVLSVAATNAQDSALSWIEANANEPNPFEAAKRDLKQRLIPEHGAQTLQHFKDALAYVEELQKQGATVETNDKGNFYHVDIPDNVVAKMLDWDKPLSEQPKVLDAVVRAGVPRAQAEKLNGQGAYLSLQAMQAPFGMDPSGAEAARSASELLRAEGIPGIKYYDATSRTTAAGEILDVFKDSSGKWRAKIRVQNRTGVRFFAPADMFTTSKPFDTEAQARQWAEAKVSEGTRNLVLFDPSHVTIKSVNGKPVSKAESSQILHQAGGQRGAFRPSDNTIALLKNADLSTYLHESGHFFLEALSGFAAAPDAPLDIKADFSKVLDWFGIAGGVDTWKRMNLEERRQYHEKFARGFERYLFEGKAPSSALEQIFSRFRAWLLNVYQHVRNLNVELTPEVRGVMDRLLASEDEIRAQQQARHYQPLFESADAAGMTPEQFRQYQALGSDASYYAVDELQRRTLNDLRWLSNAKSRELKKLQKEAAGRRRELSVEALQQVRQEPVYQAEAFLKRGHVVTPDGEEIKAQAGHQLSSEILARMYPPEELGALDWSELKRRRIASSKGTQNPDTVAEIFGFSSGDELVQALLHAEPLKDAVEARTDKLMLERYGDITDPAALERAAEAAIANDTRAKFLSREVAALSKAFGMWPAIRRAADSFAKASIAQKRIKDLRPSQFVVAEGKASRAAEDAFKHGDTRLAAQRKREQLLNNRLGRQAADAQDEVAQALRYLKKFNREGTRKNIDPEYRDQIDSLLERFDLRTGTTLAEIEKRKSLLEWIDAQREQGLEPVIDPALIDQAKRQSYKDMRLEEFRGLVDAVRNIEHLGRLKNRLLTARDKANFAAAVQETADSIDQHATKTIRDDIEHKGLAKSSKHLTAGFFAIQRKLPSLVRQMDGSEDGGVLWERLVRPMNEAGDHETEMRADATQKLTEILEPIRHKLNRDRFSKGRYIPAIDASLSYEGRLAIALNWGAAENRQRVLGGDRWTPEQAQAVLDTLDKEDWNTVQNIWDFVNSYWPQLSAFQKRVSGVEPEKVQAVPVETKFGQYRGGYYPIVYDTYRSSIAEAHAEATDLKQAMQGLYTRATPRKGFTKSRVAEVVGRPVAKDVAGVLVRHVSDLTHLLAWGEYLIDANRLLRSTEIDGAIRDHYGSEVLTTLKHALRDIAVGDTPARNAFEMAVNWIRTGTTTAALGWNFVTAALQPFGLTQSMVRIGPKWVGRGLAQFIGDAAHMENTAKGVYEKSSFMKHRGETMLRELNEIQNQIRGKRGKLQHLMYLPLQKLQLAADIPTWLGGYQKAIAEGNDEARAVALADQAVIDSQGSGHLKDLAEIQRGGPLLKIWTQFYSFFNVTLNQFAESKARTDFRDPVSVAKFASDVAMLYVVPAALSSALYMAVGSEDSKHFWKQLALDQLTFAMSSVIGLRDFSGAVSGYDYKGPSGVEGFADISALIKQIEQEKADGAFWRALNETGGVLFHYPAKQVERTAEGINAVAHGKAPLSAILFGPPRKAKK